MRTWLDRPKISSTWCGRGERGEGRRELKSSDFAGLRTLAEACKERFAYGVGLYASIDLVRFGERLAAASLTSLWD
jgi:hypothetical protein